MMACVAAAVPFERERARHRLDGHPFTRMTLTLVFLLGTPINQNGRSD